MFTSRYLVGSVLSAVLAMCTGWVFAAEDTARLGKAVADTQLQDWDLIVMPDGAGLPAGSGSAAQGRAVYEQQCASCHALEGPGLPGAPALFAAATAQDAPTPLTVGNYWPYATTLFDYVRRAMPASDPKSLSASETYEVVAFVLFMNEIIAADFVLDSETLANIEMPNRDGFIDRSHVQ